jgi:hypothetical protein
MMTVFDLTTALLLYVLVRNHTRTLAAKAEWVTDPIAREIMVHIVSVLVFLIAFGFSTVFLAVYHKLLG